MKKLFTTFALMLALCSNAWGQVSYPAAINSTNFSDAAFCQWVLNKVDTNKDGILSKAEAEVVDSIIFAPSSYEAQNIENLKGVEFFSKLQTISCEGEEGKKNPLRVAEFGSNLTKLTHVYLGYTNLETLTLPASATAVRCQDTQLTSLDLSVCKNLASLYCYNNAGLSTLDVTANPKLRVLSCYNCNLSALDLTQCPALQTLYVQNNKITTLDCSQNTLLTGLNCTENQIAVLDIANCTLLENIYCSSNKIKTLDVSRCTKLVNLMCQQNQITSLNINSADIQRVSCYNNQLAVLKIADRGELIELNCNNNKIESLDISNSPKLEMLQCNVNKIPVLDITQSTKLQTLNCHTNQLSELDVTNCPLLHTFYCGINDIAELDVSNCPNLTILYCQQNALTALDCSNLSKLNKMACSNQQKVVKVDVLKSDRNKLVTNGVTAGWAPANITNLKVVYGSTNKSVTVTPALGQQDGEDCLVLMDYNSNGKPTDVHMLSVEKQVALGNKATYTYKVPLHPSAPVAASSANMAVTMQIEPFYATYINPLAKVNNSNFSRLQNKYMATVYLDEYTDIFVEDSNIEPTFVVPKSIDINAENGGWMGVRVYIAAEGVYGIPSNMGFMVVNDEPGYYILRASYEILEQKNREIIDYHKYNDILDAFVSEGVIMANFLTGTVEPAGLAVTPFSVLTFGRRTDDQSYTLGFWNYNGNTLKQYRAYVPTEAIPSAAQSSTRFAGLELRLFEEDADSAVTGIDAVERAIANGQSSTVYDLQGRKVSAPQKGGVYITNGRKVLK